MLLKKGWQVWRNHSVDRVKLFNVALLCAKYFFKHRTLELYRHSNLLLVKHKQQVQSKKSYFCRLFLGLSPRWKKKKFHLLGLEWDYETAVQAKGFECFLESGFQTLLQVRPLMHFSVDFFTVKKYLNSLVCTLTLVSWAHFLPSHPHLSLPNSSEAEGRLRGRVLPAMACPKVRSFLPII